MAGKNMAVCLIQLTPIANKSTTMLTMCIYKSDIYRNLDHTQAHHLILLFIASSLIRLCHDVFKTPVLEHIATARKCPFLYGWSHSLYF